MIDDYKKASSEVWQFFKKYSNPRDDDEFWREVINESDQVYERWKDTDVGEYVADYVVLCVNEINRIWKRKNKNNSGMALSEGKNEQNAI